jgi:hypothetical protein
MENYVGDNGPGQDESPIVEEILAYLQTHPDAQDTLEGVVEWWLRAQTIRHRTVAAKAALEQLVKKGRLIEKKTEGGSTVYRLNPEKVREDIQKDPSGFGGLRPKD